MPNEHEDDDIHKVNSMAKTEFFESVKNEYKHFNGKFPIYSCPWCGKKFPKSLIDIYIDVLSDEYNIYFDVPTGKYFNIRSEDFNLPDEVEIVPEEFTSDKWWKNRNL